MSSRAVRGLAYGAVGGQAVFVAAWIVAGALEPRYSHSQQSIAELAAPGAAHPWIVVAGFVVLGLSVAALAPGLRMALPGRPAATVAIGLFVLTGLALVLTGTFRGDCSRSIDPHCLAHYRAGHLSWHAQAHDWAGLVGQLAILGTPYAIARAMWPSPVGAVSLAAGGFGVLFGIAAALTFGLDAVPDGIIERVELGVLFAWVVLVARAILHALRPPPDLPPLSRVRPRDFFREAWSGQAEIGPWPSFAPRWLAVRFRFTRRQTFHTDTVWTVEDRAEFARGRIEIRRFYCEFTDPTHIHITAQDLPDGAEVSVEEGGYRVWPYRLQVPIGPLRLTFHLRDRHALIGDGAVEDVIAVRLWGLPVARVTARARAEDTELLGRGRGAGVEQASR